MLKRTVDGFTLVELLVAMALGAFVVAAALGFVFQLVRAAAHTVSAARLHQEVRATLTVVAAEVRRARGAGEPRDWGAVADVDVQDSCIRYAYDGAVRVVRLHAGKVELAQGADADCDGPGIPLGSDAVRITTLRFARDAVNNDRRVEIALVGASRDGIHEATYRQVVALRSNGS
jgi:prepilin-type N-terminal cleavage/methylation domain-containing protein